VIHPNNVKLPFSLLTCVPLGTQGDFLDFLIEQVVNEVGVGAQTTVDLWLANPNSHLYMVSATSLQCELKGPKGVAVVDEKCD
jgi:hypothetical protein